MAIVWSKRSDRFNSSVTNGRDSFQEHNERMRMFRKSHADVAMVNGPRWDESTLLKSMPPLHHGGNRRVKSSQRHNGLVGSRSRMEGSTIQAFAKLKGDTVKNKGE